MEASDNKHEIFGQSRHSDLQSLVAFSLYFSQICFNIHSSIQSISLMDLFQFQLQLQFQEYIFKATYLKLDTLIQTQPD